MKKNNSMLNILPDVIGLGITNDILKDTTLPNGIKQGIPSLMGINIMKKVLK